MIPVPYHYIQNSKSTLIHWSFSADIEKVLTQLARHKQVVYGSICSLFDFRHNFISRFA